MNIQKIKHLKRCDIPRGELITVIGIFVIVFLVMIPYRDYFYFLDEKDNLLGGQTIADGGQIYTSFICGHTPGMYYISALLMKVGISSQESIRMVMYVMLLFLWIGLYFRYRKEFPPLLIPLYSIMFIALFGRTGYEHMFLAEQIQAQVYVICLCEYFLFRKRKKLTWDSSIISACAIFFAVLCAVVSVWPIVLLIIAILYQYALGIKKGELEYGQLKEVLLPFVLLCVFFAAWGIYLFVTDTWEECLWWAYRFNREIYSEYTNYGKSIITTLLNPFLTYGTMCRDVIQNLTVNFYYNIRILCEVAINFIFVFYFGQKNIVEGVLLFCFCIWTNSRGFSANPSFHALPYWSVTAFMAAFLILRICRKNQTRCAIVLLGAGIPITTSLYSVNGYKIMEQKQDISKDVRYYVDLLTEEQEPVYLVNLTGEYSYDDLKRRPAANLIYVHPWFMKVYEKQLVKQLEENSPRLITYTDDFYIWGYNVTEYTSFLRNFIIQNYCRIGEENANIWVRNDYYDEAEAILSSQEIQIYPKSEKYDGNWVLMHGVSIEQSFIADVDFISKMSLNFETFSRFNTGLITIDIKAVETGDIIYSKMICQEDIIQGWNDISFGQNLELNKGERYDIILKAFDTTKDSSVALFVNILLNDNTEALLEGGKSDYLYGIRLFQAIE